MNRETQRRYAALDGLRGIAALTVFAIHVWIYQLPNTVELRRDSWEKTLLFEGRVAFVMFFVLSGYLLYRAFARAALRRGRAGERAQLSGAPRRADRARLLRRAPRARSRCSRPAGDVPGRRLVDAAQLPLFFVFGQNYTPDTLLKLNAATWTLAVEVVFYLMLPVIGCSRCGCGAGSVRRQAALLGGLAVAGLGWNLIDYAAGWGPVARHSPPSFLPYFACGMLVALVVEIAPRARRAAARAPARAPRSSRGAVAVLVANGCGTRRSRTTTARDGGVRGLRRGGRVRRDHRRARARHRRRRCAGWARARSPGSARSPTASTSGTSRCSSARAGNGLLPARHRARPRRAAGRDRPRRGELVRGRAADHEPRGAAAGADARTAEWQRYRSQVRTIAFANPSP